MSRPCLLCQQPTDGATGAAGLFWPMLCQPCKDAEDAALAQSINQQADLFLAVLGLLPRKETPHAAD